MIGRGIFFAFFSLLLIPLQSPAQDLGSVELPGAAKVSTYPKFEPSARGFMTYRDYQTFSDINATSSYRKKETDFNEVELKGEYHKSERTELEVEIELEHGGTGSAMEFDNLEEFGEFETEQEKGGEVVLSEFYYKHRFADQAWVKAGKIPVYMSLGSAQENYFLFPSVMAGSAELSMLPEDWRELGVELQKKWGPWNGRVSVLNGLNSEFFRSYNWIGGGYQRRFETMNAGALAAHASFQYGEVVKGKGVGLAVYYGDSSSNRYKTAKLTVDAHVLLWSALAAWEWDGFGVRGEWIEGTLQNSDKVSAANSSLGNLANPGNFYPLGHRAGLQLVQLSYRFLRAEDHDLSVFASYQHVNTMESVQGSVTTMDRYNQLFSSFGAAYRFDDVMFVKAEYTKASNAMTGLPATDSYELAFGFDLGGSKYEKGRTE